MERNAENLFSTCVAPTTDLRGNENATMLKEEMANTYTCPTDTY